MLVEPLLLQAQDVGERLCLAFLSGYTHFRLVDMIVIALIGPSDGHDNVVLPRVYTEITDRRTE